MERRGGPAATLTPPWAPSEAVVILVVTSAIPGTLPVESARNLLIFQ